MKLRHWPFALAAMWLLAVATPLTPAAAQGEITPAPQFTPLQQNQIRLIIRDYLLENPDVIYEAIQILQQRQQTGQEERQRLALTDQRELLVNSPDDPTVGDPDADVVVVEFFDYKCPYCKSVWPTLAQLLSEDRGVRLVYKEFPILGQDSVYAARASLAAYRQAPEKYKAFHEALMRASATLNEDVVMRIADAVGLDVERLKEGMAAEDIAEIIENNYRLARSLGINGTPGFVIGEKVVPGAINLETLRALVREARAG